VLVEWTTSNESKVERYEIEVAKGYNSYQRNNFIKIGDVSSLNNPGEQHYQFNDLEKNKSGIRYYRLKIVNVNGTFSFSAVKPVIFDNDIEWQVYPNPSAGVFNLIYQLNENEKMTVKLYDVNGKLVKIYTPPVNGFVQKLSIDIQSSRYASGLYLIEAAAGEKKHLFRVFKQ